MADGEQLKYGWIRGGLGGFVVPIGAAEVIKAASGRFVKNDTSGRAEIAGDGHTQLLGHLECEEVTVGATEGAESRFCVNDLTAVFRIPVNSGTYVADMLADTCDLSVSSSIQGVQLDASAEDTVVIVGGDLVNNNWVDVMLNPNKMHTQGVV